MQQSLSTKEQNSHCNFPLLIQEAIWSHRELLTFQREGDMTTDIHKELYNQFTRSLDMYMFTSYPVMIYRSKTFIHSHLVEKQKLRVFKYLSIPISACQGLAHIRMYMTLFFCFRWKINFIWGGGLRNWPFFLCKDRTQGPFKPTNITWHQVKNNKIQSGSNYSGIK